TEELGVYVNGQPAEVKMKRNGFYALDLTTRIETLKTPRIIDEPEPQRGELDRLYLVSIILFNALPDSGSPNASQPPAIPLRSPPRQPRAPASGPPGGGGATPPLPATAIPLTEAEAGKAKALHLEVRYMAIVEPALHLPTASE